VALSSTLDDDSQGAQFRAPRIPNRALPKRGPCYAFPDVRVANGSTGRGAVLLPPGQSTKHPSLLSCRYFLTPLNTRDSINCFKRSLSLSLSLLHSRCRRQTQLKTFSSGPVNEALIQQLSDMRRTLIRGLQYLTLGVDLNGQKQSSASPIIVDSKLKKTAEDFSIPLSARLIYNLLVMSLLEEEGLLDDFMVERFNPGILQMTALFQTGSNARIARQAMAQETWQEKFGMAFGLCGSCHCREATNATRRPPERCPPGGP
jgi:hypothetical protein